MSVTTTQQTFAIDLPDGDNRFNPVPVEMICMFGPIVPSFVYRKEQVLVTRTSLWGTKTQRFEENRVQHQVYYYPVYLIMQKNAIVRVESTTQEEAEAHRQQKIAEWLELRAEMAKLGLLHLGGPAA